MKNIDRDRAGALTGYWLLVVMLLIVWALPGCASGPPKVYGELYLRTTIQPWTDWMLQEERSWMGDNLYLDGELGLEWDHKIKCPVFETGTSIFTGAPFHEKKAGNAQAELHWAYLKCGMKFGGK